MTEVGEFLDRAPIIGIEDPSVVVGQGLPPHVIRSIDFEAEEIRCSCGRWVGGFDDFQRHRRSLGLRSLGVPRKVGVGPVKAVVKPRSTASLVRLVY